MKRAGETLIEVITAMTIFSILFAGVGDFMANQTLALAHAKTQEKLMYYAQVLISHSSYDIVPDNSPKTIADTDITYTFNGQTLTLSKGNSSMAFKLQ